MSFSPIVLADKWISYNYMQLYISAISLISISLTLSSSYFRIFVVNYLGDNNKDFKLFPSKKGKLSRKV